MKFKFEDIDEVIEILFDFKSHSEFIKSLEVKEDEIVYIHEKFEYETIIIFRILLEKTNAGVDLTKDDKRNVYDEKIMKIINYFVLDRELLDYWQSFYVVNTFEEIDNEKNRIFKLNNKLCMTNTDAEMLIKEDILLNHNIKYEVHHDFKKVIIKGYLKNDREYELGIGQNANAGEINIFTMPEIRGFTYFKQYIIRKDIVYDIRTYGILDMEEIKTDPENKINYGFGSSKSKVVSKDYILANGAKLVLLIPGSDF